MYTAIKGFKFISSSHSGYTHTQNENLNFKVKKYFVYRASLNEQMACVYEKDI